MVARKHPENRWTAPYAGVCWLTALSVDDLELVFGWRSSEAIQASMFTLGPITFAEHVEWFRRISSRPTQCHLVYGCGDESLGVVSFKAIDDVQRTCEWGLYLGNPIRSKGHGGRMGTLSLDFAFSHIAIDTVRAQALESNNASIGYHAAMGFHETGSVMKARPGGRAEISLRTFEMTRAQWDGIREGLIRRYFGAGSAS